MPKKQAKVQTKVQKAKVQAKPAKAALAKATKAAPKPAAKMAKTPMAVLKGSVKKVIALATKSAEKNAKGVKGAQKITPKHLASKPNSKAAPAKPAAPAKVVAQAKSAQKTQANDKRKQGKLNAQSHAVSTSIQVAAANLNLKGARAVPTERASRGHPVCREVACELLSTTGGYCRMHYIKNWKKIKRKEMILKERKLNHYIEELVSKYPDKYIEAIRQDLESEKDFAKVIADLEIEEGLDDFESVETENPSIPPRLRRE